MPTKIEISVIVPVYNVAPYLAACVDSVLKQTFRQFELILVDDGSTDESGQICDQYQEQDSRVQVYHTENGGVSRARNFAMAKARGDFFIFVDSDDTIEPDMLETLYRFTQKGPEIDCVICPAQSERADHYLLSSLNEPIPVNTPLSLSDCPQLMFIRPAVWNKLIRKEILVKNHIVFDTDLAIGEDLTFFLSYIQYCRKFIYIGGKAYYHYIQRSNSTMRKIDYEKNRTLITAFDRVLSTYRANGWLARYQEELEYLAILHLYIAAIVRIIRTDYHHPLVQEIEGYMQEQFPDFRSNRYLSQLDKNKRLIFHLLCRRHYRLICLLFQLKQILGRSS